MNVQERRLRDGNAGLAMATGYESMTLAEKRAAREALGEAACAMQSLDDLGSADANAAAWAGCVEMGERLDRLGALIQAEERALAARLTAEGALLVDCAGVEIRIGTTFEILWHGRGAGERMTVEEMYPPGACGDYWKITGPRTGYALGRVSSTFAWRPNSGCSLRVVEHPATPEQLVPYTAERLRGLFSGPTAEEPGEVKTLGCGTWAPPGHEYGCDAIEAARRGAALWFGVWVQRWAT